MPTREKVSFLIPAFNEEALIGRALSSVHESAEACGLENYEVVVCDNASTDKTSDIARSAGARVVLEPHRQIARARNTAAAAADGRWLIWMDADAILTSRPLGETLAALETGKVCGGGARIQLEGVPLSWLVRGTLAAWNRISGFLRLAAGSYFFSLREGWEATGGFDEGVYAGEELGFARKLVCWGRKRGLKFFVIPSEIPSSARKIRQFSTWQVFRQMLVCAWPGNRGRRDRCAFWYERS